MLHSRPAPLRLWFGLLTVCASSLVAAAQNAPHKSSDPQQQSQVATQAELNETYRRLLELSDTTKYAEAIPLAQKAVDLGRTLYGVDDPRFARDLSSLAILYDLQGRYTDAEPLLRQVLAIRTKVLSPDHPDIAHAETDLAEVYRREGKYQEAEPLLQEALVRTRRSAHGRDDTAIATNLKDLADLYTDEGRYPEAESLYKQALEIRTKLLGPQNPITLASLNNLALLYEKQGRYGEAEPLLKQGLEIDMKVQGPQAPPTLSSMNNLAQLYAEEGRYGQAEPLFKQALEISTKVLGANHPDTLVSLNNLGELYEQLGRYREAEPLVKRALDIYTNVLGPYHPTTVSCMNNLGNLYTSEGKYQQAEPLLQRALDIRTKLLGPNHPDVAYSLNNLAKLYQDQEKYTEAEPLLQQALATLKKALSPDHPIVAVSAENIAEFYYVWQRPQEAQKYFDSEFQILRKLIQNQFAYMSEKERLDFLRTVERAFPAYSSFVYSRRGSDPSAVAELYDALLWQKGMVAYSMSAMRAKMARANDQESVTLLNQIAEKRAAIARLTASPPTDPNLWQQAQQQVLRLDQEANDLERQLVKRSPAAAQQSAESQLTWQNVQAKLHPGDAAVEFLRFNFNDGTHEHWTGKAYYAALVITPQTKLAPLFVPLGDAAVLECEPLNAYRALVGIKADCSSCAGESRKTPTSSAAHAATIYTAFWKPLEPALGNARRIYFSTDGVLNQVALGVIPDDSGKLLIEKYELRPVISTKDILHEGQLSGNRTAVLIGDPKFSATVAEQQAAVAALSKPQSPEHIGPASFELAAKTQPVRISRGSGRCSLNLQDVLWPDLHSTGTELQQIYSLLAPSWQVETYSGVQALEEAVKQFHGPRLLHIATHGFFLGDEPQTPQNTRGLMSDSAAARPLNEDPMLRSGLVFTGANRIADEQPAPEGLDDGVLTAYEAMSLDLEGTELVVLSACDTGLGQIMAGEGVFGLRRALQIAGAQSVLMSMWEVPDVETQQLMRLFYSKWMAGEEKHRALRDAQLELRRQIIAKTGHDDPRKWGAFVLVGP